MSIEGDHDARHIWKVLSTMELSGTVSKVLAANSDVFILSDVPVVHPELEDQVVEMYAGVPRGKFSRGDRVGFRLRWKKPGPGQTPALVLSDSVRRLGPEELVDLSAAAEVTALLSGIGELQRKLEESQSATKQAEAEFREVLSGIELRRLAAEADVARTQDSLNDLREAVKAERLEHQAYLAEVESKGYRRLIDALSPSSGDHRPTPHGLPLTDNPVSSLRDALQRRALTFPDQVIRRAVVAHCLAGSLGQIILYAGPPGSGKSSLAATLPRLMDGQSEVVPVRPGWLDATDILGYFDPRQNRFVPAPFLDCVLEAHHSQGSGVLHTVVLDELNIARIENYGADLLSQLEKAHVEGESGLLRLFSPSIQIELDRGVLAQFDQGVESCLAPIGATLSIPRNLLLAGTLNHDESTEMLSPKVLDRSLVVKVPRHHPMPGIAAPGPLGVCFSLDERLLAEIRDEASADAGQARAVWTQIRDLIDGLSIPTITLSHRFARCVELAPGVSRVLGLDLQDVLEDLVLLKVLPGISFFKSQRPSAVDQLGQLAGRAGESGFTLVAQEIEGMFESDDDLIDYLR
jgi:energy-coupling factor transporter ATP-binding protein EcfA2